jgi:hypothetical protein
LTRLDILLPPKSDLWIVYSTIRYFLVAPSLLQTSSLEHNKYNKILLFLGKKKQQGKGMKYTTKTNVFDFLGCLLTARTAST